MLKRVARICCPCATNEGEGHEGVRRGKSELGGSKEEIEGLV